MTQSVAMINKKSRRQAVMWLVMAGIMLILWFLMSLSHGTPATAKERQKTQAVAEDFALPVTIDNLNELSKEVPPIDFATVVRDLRNYPAEFKGKKFFEDNKKRWTVQVMDVAQNEIITEYLKGRSDREKFAYFRYHNANNEQRYILTYGIMGSTQEALGTIRVIDFGLPKSVTPMPEEMGRYVSMVDNYERPETFVDFSEEAPRSVKLQPTKKEIPAEAPKEESSQETVKPKAVKEENIADFGEEAKPNTKPNAKSGKPDVGEQPKMPPTIIPKEIPEQSKPSTSSETKPQQAEPKPEQPVQSANIADLAPAPSMSGVDTSAIPGDE
ncbi:hypothetical protein IM753_00975 [Moraxella sp. K127]|nr:hypothetical protein [Moraxella sp. K127]MBE9589570.1 hypothetical protein [Moraxella sp. K127]